MRELTSIIYLTGKPGVGKYTIAKALAASHGLVVCDNQLINYPIFGLLKYDGYMTIPDMAWESIGRIRTEVLDFLSKMRQNSYVLTNCLEETEGDRAIFKEVERMAELRGSVFVPVCLTVERHEHIRRIIRPERKQRLKSLDPDEAEDHGPLLSIKHPHTLRLDITRLTPEEAAARIIGHAESVGGRW